MFAGAVAGVDNDGVLLVISWDFGASGTAAATGVCACTGCCLVMRTGVAGAAAAVDVDVEGVEEAHLLVSAPLLKAVGAAAACCCCCFWGYIRGSLGTKSDGLLI